MPTNIETKFGEVAGRAVHRRAPGGERRCLRFSRAFDEPRLEISGWFCNAGQELVDRGMIACALDRLTLVAAGSEPKLGALFARAELKRNFCGQQSVLFAATPKRNDWIDAARDPRLRGNCNERSPLSRASESAHCFENGFCQPRAPAGARGG